MTTENWWEDDADVDAFIRWLQKDFRLRLAIQLYPERFEKLYQNMRDEDLALRRMAEEDSRNE